MLQAFVWITWLKSTTCSWFSFVVHAVSMHSIFFMIADLVNETQVDRMQIVKIDTCTVYHSYRTSDFSALSLIVQRGNSLSPIAWLIFFVVSSLVSLHNLKFLFQSCNFPIVFVFVETLSSWTLNKEWGLPNGVIRDVATTLPTLRLREYAGTCLGTEAAHNSGYFRLCIFAGMYKWLIHLWNVFSANMNSKLHIIQHVWGMGAYMNLPVAWENLQNWIFMWFSPFSSFMF
jgi:hypothetical protein